MLGNAFNGVGRTNLLAGKGGRPEVSSGRRHLMNQLNRLLNQYFGILIVIAVVLVFFLSYQFILRPKYQSILGKINTNAFASKQLEPKYQELANYEKLAEAYSQLDPKVLAKYDGLVPKEYIKEDLFAETLYLLSHNGYEVRSLDVSREGDGAASSTSGNIRTTTKTPAKTEKSNVPTGVGLMRVSVSVANIDYPGLKKLLGVVEHNLRLTDVQQVTFDPASKTAVLDLATYYIKK